MGFNTVILSPPAIASLLIAMHVHSPPHRGDVVHMIG
jgi:hypothetical protein